MKRFLCIIPLLWGLICSSCYHNEIDEINNRLDRLEGTHIASIQEQITNINKSLDLLKDTDTILDQYIDWLENSVGDLEESVGDLNGSVSDLEESVGNLNGSVSDLEELIGVADKAINTLVSKQAELEQMIEQLTTYVNDELAKNKDWANATFATLEQYSSLASEVATIKNLIATINSSLEQFGIEVERDIESAINTLETSIKEWVNDQLESYYTIAEVEGKLEALQTTITEGDTALQDEIDQIIVALEEAKQEVTEAYTQAIEEAINENNGVIDGKIAVAIAEVNVRIDNEVESINQKIASIESRLDNIEGNIASITEQIANINNTIEVLETAKAELENYIDWLENSVGDLEESVGDLNGSVSDLEESVGNLNGSVSDLEELIGVADKAINTLVSKQAELEQMIEQLTTYVNDELAKNKDWANATFATLEQYSSLASEVATIKNLIATINSSLEQFGIEVERDIESAIDTLEASMKEWVSTQLEGYYTIAEVEGKLEALQTTITEGDTALQDEIDQIIVALEEAKQEVTEAYTQAIEEAINENNGVIDGKIAVAIAEVNVRIDNEIEEINQKIASIESRLDNIEADIADLMSRIQSVTYIPQYSDGKATLSYNHDISRVRLDFEISPKDAVDKLADVWESALSVKSVLTMTRAVDFIPMPIVSFSADADSGVISMYVSGENVLPSCIDSNKTASAALVISDGNNSIISDYVPLVVEEVTKEIWYTSANNAVINPYNSTTIDATIVSNTYDLGMGIIRFDAPITQIGPNTFNNRNNLLEITIPASVTSIGSKAFYSCDLLSTVNMGEGIQSIGDLAFANNSCLMQISIPDSVTSLSATAFRNTSLKSFESKDASSDGRCLIVDGVLTHFAKYGLTQYSIPSGVTKIGDYAFADCSNYTEITIPTSVTEIGDYSFLNCSGLEAIVIPESVTKIGDYAFNGCTKITDLAIHRNITDLGSYTFANCSSLSSVDCKPITPPAGSKMFGNNADDFTIYVSIGTLSDYRNAENWMEYNDFIQAIVDPNTKISYTTTDDNIITPTNLEAIGLNISYNSCDNGVGLMIFDGDITTIGNQAFQNCTTLKTITYPDTVTNIGSSAFAGCTGLTEFTISDNITSVGYRALAGCTNLDIVTINSNALNGSFTFEDCSIRELYINCDLKDSDYGYELGGATYENVIFGDNVTFIGEYAFYNDCNVSNIILGSNIEHIGGNAFASTDIKSIVIPNSVTSLGYSVFASCANLTDVTIGSGLATINQGVFANCTSLESIVIPAGITTIEANAFLNCSSLSDIYCKATTPPALDTYSFKGCPEDRVAYVPTEAKSAYLADPVWSKMLIMGYDYATNTIAPPANNEIWYTTTTGEAINFYSGYDFDKEILSNTYTNGLGMITFNGDVTEIKPQAFNSSSNLKKIYLPESLVTIPCNNYDGIKGTGATDVAFVSDTLEEVYIAGTPDLYGNPFFLCPNIAKFSGPLATKDGCALIKGSTLYSFAHNSTSEYTIPSTVKTIGHAAFYYSLGSQKDNMLKKVNIPKSVTTMEFDAFYFCRVTVNMESLESWCKITFGHMYANPLYQGGKNFYINGELVTTLTIPSTITTVKQWAFAGANVESIVVGDSVTRIEDNAFDWNKASTVTIGKNVTYIGTRAFRDTDSYQMTAVYIKATTPPTLGSAPFDGYSKSIYVPSSSASTYKSSTVWSSYTDQIVGYTF